MIFVNSLADLSAAIVTAEQIGAAGLAHLMRAFRSGRIAFLPLLPDTSAKKFKLWGATAREVPAVALLGDDDYRDRGPPGWPLATRACRWAASVILHAAGAEIAHYEMAIAAAQLVRRVAIIECSTAMLPRWLALVEAVRPMPATLIVRPGDGASHPVVPPASARQ